MTLIQPQGYIAATCLQFRNLSERRGGRGGSNWNSQLSFLSGGGQNPKCNLRFRWAEASMTSQIMGGIFVSHDCPQQFQIRDLM